MATSNFSLRKHLIVLVGLLIGLCTSAKAELYKLSVTKLAEARSEINLMALPETLLDSDLNIVGDDFVAELSPATARSLGLPHGTKMIGTITEMNSERSLSRSAACIIDINKLQLADGTTIAAKASLALSGSKDRNIVSSIAKSGARVGASTLVGAMDAVQYAGIGTAIMTHGITAGVGATIGLGMGLANLTSAKGQRLRSDGFKLAKMKLVSDFELLEPLPKVSEEQLAIAEAYRSKLDKLSEHLNSSTKSRTTLGLDIKLRDIDKYFSASYGEFVILDFDIANRTSREIYPQDLVLSSAKHLKPLYSNPFIYNDGFTALKPGEKRSCRLAFAVGDYDRDDDYELKLIDSSSERIILSYDLQSLRASHL